MKLYVNLTLNKLSISAQVRYNYLVHSIAGLQGNVYSTYSTEDKLKILAVEVLTHLLDKSDLK